MSSTPINPNPLQQEHLDKINNALAAAEAGMQAIELAKRAGIDVSAQEKQLQDSITRLKSIKQVYFPNA